MQFCFVSTRRGSHFMTELLGAFADALADEGHSVELVLDAFPQRDLDCVYVVVPHEFDAWGDPSGFPDARQRARTIALCTENHGTEWFEATYRLISQYAAAAAINRASAAELRRRGIRCEHVQLGYVPSWDSWRRDEATRREIEVLYLGAADPRRDPLLAGLGGDLARRRCEFLVPPLEPRTGPRPDFLTGARKYQRLRAAEVLLNLHRTTSAALEWMRFLEAICNGCVVVSEPSIDGDPLIAGEHFVEARADRIGQVIDDLLDEPDSLRATRQRAYDFVREELPMRSAATRLAELAAELPRSASPETGRALGAAVASDAEVALALRLTQAGTEPTSRCLEQARRPVEDGGASPGVFGTTPARRGPERLIRRLRRALGTDGTIDIRSRSYDQARPHVSVISVVAPGNEQPAVEALVSIGESSDCRLEVLTVATATGGPLLERFSRDHPSLPFASYRVPAIDTPGAALNRLIEHARGDHVFVMDPRGGVFPGTLTRLAEALDGDRMASFAYSMVAVFEGERATKLRSSLPWEPVRLMRDDWIDGMALVRRERLIELGCFTTDPSLAGWEAFDLWCRCAETGGYGLHVPQVLAWHRDDTGWISVEHDDPDTAGWRLMRRRHPALLQRADDAASRSLA
jgi:Glycosyl transferases group 1